MPRPRSLGAWLAGRPPPLGSYALLLARRAPGRRSSRAADRARPAALHVRQGRDRADLVTYAVFLILEDVIKLIWGVESLCASQPYGLLGNFDVAGLPYPSTTSLLVAVAIVVGASSPGALSAPGTASCCSR